jgi:hypothetical protein
VRACLLLRRFGVGVRVIFHFAGARRILYTRTHTRSIASLGAEAKKRARKIGARDCESICDTNYRPCCPISRRPTKQKTRLRPPALFLTSRLRAHTHDVQ